MSVSRTVLMGRRLWQHAERDIASARMVLQPGGYYVAANLAHQAAEKALKAAHWHLRAEEGPWSHDLGDLAERLVEAVGHLPAEVREAIDYLLPMFAQTRYPSGEAEDPIPPDVIGLKDAQHAIASAEEVMAWVQTQLRRPPRRAQRRPSC